MGKTEGGDEKSRAEPVQWDRRRSFLNYQLEKENKVLVRSQ